MPPRSATHRTGAYPPAAVNSLVPLARASIPFAAVVAVLLAAATPAQRSLIRVSVNSAGAEGDRSKDSNIPSISADGNFVAFDSEATNFALPFPDQNQVRDVFVRDTRNPGSTRLVSVTAAGIQGDQASSWPSISGDGRFVAFQSDATNLVDGDDKEWSDVFVRDMTVGTIVRVSVSSGGDKGNGDAGGPSISPDGRYVAFWSRADNLLGPQGDGNGVADVFLHDRDADGNGVFDEPGGIETRRVSVAHLTGEEAKGGSSGECGLWVSAFGRCVAFESSATNLVANDDNFSSDIFVHEVATRSTTRVSVDDNGNAPWGMSKFPSICADTTLANDGRFVTFQSWASLDIRVPPTGLQQIFLHDRVTQKTELISVDPTGTVGADRDCYYSMPSPDGSFVVFDSWGGNLVDGDKNNVSDVFRRDRRDPARMVTIRLSVDIVGGDPDDHSTRPRISADANRYAWESRAGDLIAADHNEASDVFLVEDVSLWPRGPCPPPQVRQLTSDAVDNLSAAISGNGQVIAFVEQGHVFAVNADGSGRRQLSGADRVGNLVLSVTEDGSRVCFKGSGNRIWTARTDGGGLVEVAGPIADLGRVTMSADGRKIVYHAGAGAASEVFVMNADGTGLRQLSANNVADHSPAISGDGSTIAFVRDDPATPCTDGDVWQVDSSGANERRLTWLGRCAWPSLDRTGSRMAFLWSRDACFGDTEVFSLQTTSGALRQLTDDQDRDGAPSLSLDGSRILFAADTASGLQRLGFIAFDGTSRTMLWGGSTRTVLWPRWSISADGQSAAFVSTFPYGQQNPEGDLEVFLITSSRLPPTLTTAPQRFPALGPTGLGNAITEVAQIELLPYPGAPGMYNVAAAVRYAGRPDWEVTTGVWQESPQTFWRTPDVDGENTAGDEFALTLSDDLLVMALDTPSGPRFSVRATPLDAFPASAPIGLSGYVDPKLCRITGVESLVFVCGTSICVADFDRTAYRTGGNPLANRRTLAANVDGALSLHSPEPLRDGIGDARAFLLSIRRSAGVSDAAFLGDVAGDEPPRLLRAGGTWQNNPGTIGGSTFWAETPYGDPTRLDMVASHSAVLPKTGGLLRLAIWAPTTMAGNPAFLLLGRSSADCRSFPTVSGHLILDPGSIVLLGPATVSADGLAEMVLPLPRLPAGLAIDTQPWVIDAAGAGSWLGNDSVLVVR